MPAVRICLEVTPWPGTTLTQAVETAARAGFGCLDLDLGWLDEYLSGTPLAQFDHHLRAQRLYVAAISGSEPLPADDRQALLLAQARLLQGCVHLDALGGGVLTVYPRRQNEALSAAAPDIRALQALAALAAPFDVLLAIESESVRYSASLIEQVACPNVWMALNAESLPHGKTGLSGLPLDRLALVHLGDMAGLPPAGPEKDAARHTVRQTCAWLVERGFWGPYSVRPAAGRAAFLDAAREAHDAVANLLAAS